MFRQALCIVIFLTSAWSTFAAEQNPYEVSGVEVYAESDSLDNARRDAINKGTEDAFETLLKRVMPSSMQWKIDNIKRAQIFDMVKETKVEKERMTSKTYMATVTISFKSEEIKNVLNRLGANYASEYASTALVVPIINYQGQYLMWGENDWAHAWDQMPAVFGLSRFTYALGDLEDQTEVDQLQVFKEPVTKYKHILEKYNAGQMLFILVKESNGVFDTTIRLLSDESDVMLKAKIPFENKGDKVEIYKTLGLNLLEKVDDYFKGVNPFDEHRTFKTRMTVPFANVKEWPAIKAKLAQIAEVVDVQEIKTNNESVEIDLVYSIEPLEMSETLARGSFEVSEEGDIQYLRLIKK